jgi:L-threonylcarbamoyladenylate synthase
MSLLSGWDTAAVEAAAETLVSGGLLGLPTETVYGLAARADDDAAVAAIFRLKGRPADHPLIVHVSSFSDAQRFAAVWPESAARLTAAFWPGPLTVIVPRVPGLATAAAAGQSTVALRFPAHPVARAVLEAAARRGVHGVAAPSANRFGRISPTTAQHVAEEFGPELTVLDGGACGVGIESSIVDCSREHPVLLRPGQLARSALEAALGCSLQAPDASAPRAPGMLASHYAPRAPLRLAGAPSLAAALQGWRLEAGASRPVTAVYSRTLPAALVRQWEAAAGRAAQHRNMPAHAEAAAHQLFADLRALDSDGAALIWVETPPMDAAWDGVRDRLMRASAA